LTGRIEKPKTLQRGVCDLGGEGSQAYGIWIDPRAKNNKGGGTGWEDNKTRKEWGEKESHINSSSVMWAERLYKFKSTSIRVRA